MTNKTKIIIGVGSAVALVGGYFIYKALRPKKPIVIDKDGNVVPTTTPTTTPSTSTTTPSTTTPNPNVYSSPNMKKYKVNVSKGNLNIREQPNDKSKVVGFVSKDCIIECEPSTVEGWLEIISATKEGTCKFNLSSGYVSSKYLLEVK